MTQHTAVAIERARLDDAPQIVAIVNGWADRGEMLHRTVEEIYEAIRDFRVARVDGEIIGCAALHIMGSDLAEVRSLAVREDIHGGGIGGSLVRDCLSEAGDLGLERVFALTYRPGFFERQGFRIANVMEFPRKVWNECVRCPFFTNCKEVAVVIDLVENPTDFSVPQV